jgi:hypothetical protein
MSASKNTPSIKEISDFMIKEAQPYRFEYVKDMQPLRVSIEKKLIYVNEKVLMHVIQDLVKDGLDWKEVMRKNLQHEKTHEKFFEWNRKWGVDAMSYGWLASYLTDIVIDKLHFAKDDNFQKWLIADSRHAFRNIRKEVWDIFPTVASRAHFLYNQAAYWITIGAITLDEAAEVYPEKINYIAEMSQLFSKIQKENDLEWAFPKAKMIYLRVFGQAS